ncbi:zinc-binding alcohol dehydrogenase [Thalassobaculum sp. OXR-137]|uniref:zinc-dependent alcohol dehydrogenase n=1 Tax=Thalassobaculum sp. OXR-137 TaxID=3100173 RepID=UPI002AC9D3AE|nr:zinc-binding alcohol dehydrogenase [Thalassobaculum sp. OXR-137]WPZ33646.1 zinc-binding alcohol dehydrogenase [Thalassobaculum sp. OXR-137]
MTQARAFWVVRPNQGEIRQEAIAPAGLAEVAVRTLYSGISRGTETLVFAGRVPESQHAAMRCPFQAGTFPGPVKYGYCAVGVLDDGRVVFSLHPHQDRFVVPAEAVRPVPEDVPAARAVLAANMETALNALWDSGIAPGDRVAVVGLGVVGLLIAYLAARLPGVDLVGIDPNPARGPAAAALGIPFSTDAPDRYDADLVVHASGTPNGLATALSLAGTEATVLEASWHGSAAVPVPLGEAFHSRRLVLRSTQVGMVSPAHRPRWDYGRRLDKALSLLADPALDVLIDGESPFTSLPDTMAALADGSLAALCHRIRYPD